MTRTLTAWLGLWMLFGLAGQAAMSDRIAYAAQREPHGLLLLYPESQAGRLEARMSALADQDCAPWRGGPVAGASGSLDIGAADRFLLLACASEILSDPGRRAALPGVSEAGSGVRALEGRILLRDPEQPTLTAQRKRAYILKISHYSNSDPVGRDRDLVQINALAGARADAWKTEGFVAVERAVGMPTPDEVVVIHYDDPDQGARFRKSNPDLLERIGVFNDRHLTSYTYLSATTER